MGVGAVIPLSVEPPHSRSSLHSPIETLNGLSIEFVRLRPGVSTSLALASLRKIARIGVQEMDQTPDSGSSVNVQSVLYPAEIENYRTIGIISGPAGPRTGTGRHRGARLTLIASVHRRRRDLALLRTLGFTPGDSCCRRWPGRPPWRAPSAFSLAFPPRHPGGPLALDSFCEKHLRPTVPFIPLVIVALSALVLSNLVAGATRAKCRSDSAAQVMRGE